MKRRNLHTLTSCITNSRMRVVKHRRDQSPVYASTKFTYFTATCPLQWQRLPRNYDLRSAKTKICKLETNLANSSKHTHDSRLSNKYPLTDRDLFAIGESCVVDIESNSVARWCVLVSGFLGMSHGDFELVGITVGLKRGVGE